MKRLSLFLAFVLLAATVQAGSHTVTLTTGQETQVTARVIPLLNTRACAAFGLAANCTSANLTTAGCVAAPALSSSGSRVPGIRSCTIYTADATGVTNLCQDVFNIGGADLLSLLNGSDQSAMCAWLKAGGSSQDTACVAAGLAAGCVCQ